MGRRSSPLVTAFFARGAKLGHNRYHHTCKKCGEEFPKGRIDSLTSHLLRKCPGLTDGDRGLVFQQIQRGPAGASSGEHSYPDTQLSQQIPSDAESQRSSQIRQQYQKSALDTLAEVSRQHLDYSSYHPRSRHDHNSGGRDLSEIVAEQALLAELRAHTNAVSTARIDKATPAGDLTEHGSLAYDGSSLSLAAPVGPSPLMRTASAANEQLSLNQPDDVVPDYYTTVVDPKLGQQSRELQVQNVEPDPAQGADMEIVAPMLQLPGSNEPMSLSMRNSHLAPGLWQKPTGNKKRGRFEENRRKEVSEVRKRGACIRCRMLKKPCSEGTPCSTCASVGAARLWKGKCLRTRLADECTAFFRSFYILKAENAVPSTIQGSDEILQPGYIKARLLTESDQYMSFSVVSCGRSSDLATATDGESTLEPSAMLLLAEEKEMSDKIGCYIECVADALVEKEPSLFMRSTLQVARTLSTSGQNSESMRPSDSSDAPRKSYNVHDLLMKSVVQLWLSAVLVSLGNAIPLQLRYDSKQRPQKTPEAPELAKGGGVSAGDAISKTSETYNFVKIQLLAGLELHCSKLSKIVLNELEKRLLQRQQRSRFTTFLASVILLNAVERMCSFYSTNISHDRSPISDRPFVDGSHVEREADRLTAIHYPGDYDLSTSNLWSQGQHFCELLAMLLRMRALMPKTEQATDGTLRVVSSTGPIYINGAPIYQQMDEQTCTVAAWLDPLHLDIAELVSKSNGVPESADTEQAWDMIFVSQLLLPESI